MLASGPLSKRPDGEFDAAVQDGQYFYAAGRHISTPNPILVRWDAALAQAVDVTGNGVGRVTALAANGNGVFFAGVADQAMTLDGTCGTTLAQGLSLGMFVVAWNTSLSCTLVHEFGGVQYSGLVRAADAVNNTVVMAGHSDSANLWCQRAPGFQHFIGRYDSTRCHWAKAFLLGTADEGIYATAHKNGRVVVVGSYQGGMAGIAGCRLPAARGIDGFIAILNQETGDCLGVNVLSGPGKDVATALALDAAHIYVAGRYQGSPDFGGCSEQLPDAGSFDAAFVAKLTMDVPKPHILWTRGYTTSGGVDPRALTHFGRGDLRLAGSFTGDGDFGGGDLINPTGFARIFVAKLDATTGQHLLSAFAPTFGPMAEDGDDIVTAILPTPQEGILLAGSYVGDTPLTGNMELERAAYVVDTELQP